MPSIEQMSHQAHTVSTSINSFRQMMAQPCIPPEQLKDLKRLIYHSERYRQRLMMDIVNASRSVF